MRLLTAVFALSLFTSSASADSLWFDPPNSTSRTPVIAHMRLGGCPVFGSSVSADGNAITVTISTMTACAAPPPLEGYAVTADLGLLPAGIYDFKVVTAGAPPFTLLTTKLAVADANPPFVIEPNVVPIGGGQVTLTSDKIEGCGVSLLDIPNDGRSRITLRVYSIDGPADVAVGVAPFAPHQRSILHTTLTLTPVDGSADLAEASLDITAPTQPLAIFCGAYGPQRIWAFVSITNNETQHATVMSPE